MFCSRRKFLIGASLLAGAAFCVSPFRLLADSGRRFLVVGSGKNACRIDLATRGVESLELGFVPHSFLQHPQEPGRFITVEKWGPHAAEVDFRKAAVRSIPAPERHLFYGHGAFTPDGGRVFISCVDQDTGLGHVAGFDADTLVLAGRHAVAPGRLHQIHFLPDGTLLTASTGVRATYGEVPEGKDRAEGERVDKSALIHMDLAAGKVLGRNAINHDANEGLAHFCLTQQGQVVAVCGIRHSGSTRSGGIYFSAGMDVPLKKVELGKSLAARMRGEMLSVAVDETRQVAAITNPDSATVLFVDARAGKTLGHVRQKAYGVAYDAGAENFLCNGMEGLFRLAGDKSLPFLIPGRKAGFDGKHSLIV